MIESFTNAAKRMVAIKEREQKMKDAFPDEEMFAVVAIRGKRINGLWKLWTVAGPTVGAEGHAKLNTALVELFATLRKELTKPQLPRIQGNHY